MRPSSRFLITISAATAAAMAGAALLTGCPGSLDDINRFRVDGGGLAPPLDSGPVDCPTAIPRTLATCSAAGCHSGTVPAGELDLTGADPRVQMRNKPSVGNPALLLIDTSNFPKSVIYTKTGAAVPFGLPMPTAGTPLDEGTRACLLQWIEATPAGAADAGGLEASSGDAATD